MLVGNGEKFLHVVRCLQITLSKYSDPEHALQKVYPQTNAPRVFMCIDRITHSLHCLDTALIFQLEKFLLEFLSLKYLALKHFHRWKKNPLMHFI